MRVDLGELLEYFSGTLLVALFGIELYKCLKVRFGLHEEAFFRLKLGEVAHRGFVMGVETQNHLMRRDRTNVEAIPLEMLRDDGVFLDGFVSTPYTTIEIADLADDIPILRVFVEPGFVLFDGLFDLVCADRFVRCFEDLVFIEGHLRSALLVSW